MLLIFVLPQNNLNFFSLQKLEWETLSIDLLPHPDMFTDATLGRSQVGSNLRDDDGAKRVFFGGERFIEGISGEAYVMNIVPSTSCTISCFCLEFCLMTLLKYDFNFIFIRSLFRELN
jgi:hypothetical protein